MKKHNGMRPQDVVVLLKLSAQEKEVRDFLSSNNSPSDNIKDGKFDFSRLRPITFFNPPVKKEIAYKLGISPAEVTESLARSAYAGLYDSDSKQVKSLALMDFLQYGLKYVFPQQPGALVRGIPTGHSAKPLSSIISSNEMYVWPNANGTARGQAIEPLYHTVDIAIKNDEKLYELLALTDALRIGKSREVAIAVEELKKRLLPN